MNRSKRPIEAILPTASRPQITNIGKRRRIDHLSNNTRLQPGTLPFGLPNETRDYRLEHSPGRSQKGLAYRNAVFQALLNTPMFVNFLRMHDRRWPGSKPCPIKTQCLTCAMYRLADQYWLQTWDTERTKQVRKVCEEFWEICRKTFWPKSSSTGNIGPSDLDAEYYSDTFLLNLLTEMRCQLEVIPSEYQTFEKMFTVHTVRRWKCNGAWCNWVSPPYKWESSLHLNLAVQKLHSKSRQTPALLGIQRALHTPTRLAARRGSISHRTKCEKCQRVVESYIDIVNLPEILIVIRDTEELSPEDDPDIPFREELNVSSLASGPDDAFRPKKYELVSGIGEHRYNRLVSRNYAFARGPEDIRNKWFCILDENVVEMDFSSLERLQRSKTDGGLAGEGMNPLCPEIFVYRRKNYGDHADLIDSFGPISPLNDLTIQRDVIASSINDIFIQKIGRGLLKFKVKIAPAATDEIEGDLQLSYEVDGKHYGMKLMGSQDFLRFQLRLLQDNEPDAVEQMGTPFEGRVIDRAVQRIKGVYMSKEEGQLEMASFAAAQNLPDPNIPTGNAGNGGTLTQYATNPFAVKGPDMMEDVVNTSSQESEAKKAVKAIEVIIDRQHYYTEGGPKKIIKKSDSNNSNNSNNNNNHNGSNNDRKNSTHSNNNKNRVDTHARSGNRNNQNRGRDNISNGQYQNRQTGGQGNRNGQNNRTFNRGGRGGNSRGGRNAGRDNNRGRF